jgi:hypothetical protein
MCFDNLIQFYAYKFYDISPFVPLQACFKWHEYSSFKKEEKLTYLSNYLTKLKQKIEPFEDTIILKKLSTNGQRDFFVISNIFENHIWHFVVS